MLFANRPPQYPHLVTYLDHLRRAPKRDRQSFPVGAVITVVFFAALIMGDRVPLLKWLAMALLLGLAAWYIYQYSQGRPLQAQEPETKLHREAQESGALMRAALQHNRLHRDLGEPTLILLDEAGRQWSRVEGSLGHPFWGSGALPVHYESVREQSARAAESAMNEILTLFLPLLPDTHVRRPVMDYVGEALETIAKRPKDEQPLPPAYGQARDLVERMRTLADELERITTSAALDPSTFEQKGAKPALDGAIHDLRNIRQAEDELRQGLQ